MKAPDSDLDPASTGDLVLGDREGPLLVELGPDGRLKAPRERTRAILRDRLHRAEVLLTGPQWAVMRSLDPLRLQPDPDDREVVMAGVLSASSIALIDLIGFLASGHHTGVMSVAVGDVTRSIYLSRGDLLWAESTAVEEQIGDYLISRGKITRTQLAEVLRGGADHIGRACVERGYVSAAELSTLVQAQLTDIFDHLMATEDGLWTFARLAQQESALPTVHLPTQHLLMDACRKIDEMRLYRSAVRSADAVLRKAELEEAATNARRLSRDVAQSALALFEQLPASTTIGELMRRTGRSEYDLTRLVYHLQKANMVSVMSVDVTGAASAVRNHLPQAQVHEIVKIYSMALQEMFEEVRHCGHEATLLAKARAYLDQGDKRPTLLRAVRLREGGALDEEALTVAGQAAAADVDALIEPLDELLFFLLFESGELLGARIRDDLARRIKMIHGMLDAAIGAARP